MLYRQMFFLGIILSQILFLAPPSTAQTREWTRLCGTGGDDVGYGVAADAFGNVYVAGCVGGTLDGQTNAGGSDICLIKYDSSGGKLWTRLCGTAGNDGGMGVAVDSVGNIYVTGCVGGTLDGQTFAGGNHDICLLKYDSSGAKLWTRLCGTAADDVGFGVVVDAFGNLYVTGYTNGALDGQTNAGGSDICLIKYDSSGSKLWTRLCGSSGNDAGTGIAVDSIENVYVTGVISGSIDSQSFAGGYRDICLLKYNSSGTRLWTRLCGSSGDEGGGGVAMDHKGNVYITGYAAGPFDGQTFAGGGDICLLKYDSNGIKLWTRFYSTTGVDYGTNLAVDYNSGDVYVTGYSNGIFQGQVAPGGENICIIKCDSNGTRQGAPVCGSNGNDRGLGVAVDAGGNVYITGYVSGSFDSQTFAGGYYDIYLLKCSPLTTKVLSPIARPAKRITTGTVIQMFDISGRRISSKDLLRRPAGIYLVRSKSASFCEVKMRVK